MTLGSSLSQTVTVSVALTGAARKSCGIGIKWLRACILLLLLLGSARGGTRSLLDDFRDPPASARPRVYWFFMDGNLSREGITADLEAMKEAGLGGVILMEVDVGVPRGPVRFMSEPWRALFKHAVTEAERLGLEITLNAGPGWTGSGGPWVKPEQSMQHIVASETSVTGGRRFEGVLPQPQPRPPFFGPVPAELEPLRSGFYRDVAVLAFPTPEGAYRIADLDDKALYVRAPYSSQPGVKPYLPAPAEYPALPVGKTIARDRIVDLTQRMDPNGRLVWDVPEGNWTILRCGRTTTGANTRPAPQPGLGFESDKFDPAALDAHFDAFVGALLREIGPRPTGRKTGWTMLHMDSWEMGSQNWSAGFRAEFQRRRGYDPLPYLPVMTGRVVENLEISERLLWDLRQTAQELVIENHAEHLKALGRHYGFGLSIEPYDMNPCSDLSLGGVADVPMCEFWAKDYGFNTTYSCLEAVSIAHTVGRPVVAAEAFTSDDKEAWRLYPGAMKRQADWAFCLGINRLVFHRYAHQPWPDRRPGMTMGPYGVHYERTQTWWPMVGAWHQYLARCQAVLQRGQPVVDICYLAPQGAPHVFRPPASALRGPKPLLDRKGYNFDGCAPETLLAGATVKNRQLMLPGGTTYRVLVLPEMETMTPALLRKIRDLVQAGATVIGPRPVKSPSLSNYPACDQQVQRLAAELWGPASSASDRTPERRVGRGRIVTVKAPESDPNQRGYPDLYCSYELVADVLGGMGVPPDLESDADLRYTHRREGDIDIYFVATPADHPVDAGCSFRVAGKHAEIWDPVTGATRTATPFEEEGHRTRLRLALEPGGSAFVVFRKAGRREEATVPADSDAKREASPAQTGIEIRGPWEVRFESGRGAPEKIILEELLDWSKHSDPGVRYFSGRAIYRTTFSPDLKSETQDLRWMLDLGQVQVMAQVKLNGKDLGVLWTAPFQVEITRAVRPGTNVLEVTVANLWPNRLIGDLSLPPEQRVTWTTWNPFRKDTPLLPSGLLGPVRCRIICPE
jgi:hypothetical protein